MYQRDINPKKWFYAFQAYLQAHQTLPGVLAGSACEQWLNTEFYHCIARLLTARLTIYQEYNKKDLAILRVTDSGETDWASPEAIIESKVIYLNYGITKREHYINRLYDQVTAAAQTYPNVPCYGFLFAAYASRLPIDESDREFRGSINRLMRQADELFPCRPARKCLETLLPRSAVVVGQAKATVGLYGQYLVLHSQAPLA